MPLPTQPFSNAILFSFSCAVVGEKLHSDRADPDSGRRGRNYKLLTKYSVITSVQEQEQDARMWPVILKYDEVRQGGDGNRHSCSTVASRQLLKEFRANFQSKATTKNYRDISIRNCPPRIRISVPTQNFVQQDSTIF